MNKDALIKAAFEYIDAGYSIIPVNIKKTPLFKWKEYQKRLPREGEVIKWFSNKKAVGIAIITGKISNLVVIDTEKGADVETLNLPKTATSKSGGGGLHFYFKYPKDTEIKNSEKLLADLVDVRGEGGYIIAPPSQHQSGNIYEWSIFPKEENLVELPAEVIKKLNNSVQANRTTSSKGTEPKSLFRGRKELVNEQKRKEWEDINQGVGKGQRNSAATKVCGKLIQSYGLNNEKVWEELEKWDLKNTPPLQKEGRELHNIFNSIFNRAARERRVKVSKDLSDLQGMDSCDLKAQAFMSEKNIIHYDRQWFEYREGVWRAVTTDQIKGSLAEFYIQTSTKYSSKIINNTFEFLASRIALEYRAQIEPKIKNKSKRSDELAASNGILDIGTLELRGYKKEDYIFTKLPFSYKKEFECPLWVKFLNDVFSEYDDLEKNHIIKFVQEWMGYSLIADTSLESFIILIGGGANGKSVFLNIWKSVLGEENVTSIDLKDINGEQYVSMLFGKLANICTDIQSGQQLDSGIFKRLVSGDTVTAKEVYKKPFQFTPYARLIFSTNSLPYLKNVDNAMRRRTHILRFNRTFERSEQDRNLYKKLRQELPGIFNWSIIGLSRLKSRGHFDEPKSVINEIETFMKQNDIVALWMEEGEIGFGNYWVERTFLYKDFNDFCIANGKHAPSSARFYEALKNKGLKPLKRNGIWGFLLGFNPDRVNYYLDKINSFRADRADKK